MLGRLSVLMALVAAGSATAQILTLWPDTYAGRLEALALVQTLNATLLGSRSATFTLERWCAEHDMAQDPRIRARLVRGAEKPVGRSLGHAQVRHAGHEPASGGSRTSRGSQREREALERAR